MIRPLFALLLLSTFTGTTWANNNLFLPGDAFFHATLTQESVEKLVQQQPLFVLENSLQDAFPGTFCGNAGYRRAEVEAFSPQFVKNLKWTYDLIRKSDRRELREIPGPEGTTYQEINGLLLFLMRKDFDIEKYRQRLGLRYNENWVSEAEKYDKFLQLCCFVQIPEAIEASWRDSRLVPGLEVTLPQATIQEGRAVEVPVKIKGEVQAILVRSGPVQPYFDVEDSREIYVVTEKETTIYLSHEGRWAKYDTYQDGKLVTEHPWPD
ncbi:hypothetical protein [Blastopirellula marina]|uniref:Uncharacterized protein n=1 Tax=Blastopirellula marina TaxID=124 RepID=A0A2S8GLJ1_9BACT|nr:hypothetical protein [Blastopirellula marina]PQO45303.1 hypothetical protein C5Y93_15225 [Blastopirellula marina]